MTHDAEDQALDELVPAPWSTARRMVAGAVVTVLIAVVGVLLWAGVLAPNLVALPTLGGSAEVGTWQDGDIVDTSLTILIPIENRGWVSATLDGWRPPETRGVTWEDTARPLPVTLEPGEVVELELAARIASCREVDARGTRSLDLIVHGPVGMPLTSSVDAPTVATLPTWPTSDGDEPLTDLDQHDPSWLYHAFGWACDPSAVDIEERTVP